MTISTTKTGSATGDVGRHASDDRTGIDSRAAREIASRVGFLVIPGATLDSTPAYLLVALRATPTLAHFDPERIDYWALEHGRAVEMRLQWPVPMDQLPTKAYSWGTIEIVDRVAAANRFASFGGRVVVSRDERFDAILFRSDAPILAVGGHSGPADPLGVYVAGFLGRLRATAGEDRRLGAWIDSLSPVALYAAFVDLSIATKVATQKAGDDRSTGFVNLLRQERSRLVREWSGDQVAGAKLACVLVDRRDIEKEESDG